MSRTSSLLKNTAIVGFGQICTKCISFFLLPLYTALLTTEDYGTVDLLNSYVSFLLPIVVFQIEDAMFRFIVEIRNQPGKEKRVISTILIFDCMQCAVFALIFLPVNFFVRFPYAWYLFLSIAVNIFLAAFWQLCRGLGDNAGYAFFNFLNALLTTLLNLLLIAGLKMGAVGMLLATLAANTITLVLLMCRTKIWRWFSWREWNFPLLKNLLSYSMPMVPNTVSWWVIGASDKTIVNIFLGYATNGILSVSQKFSSMFSSVTDVFTLTWKENASLHCRDEDYEEYFSEIFAQYTKLLCSLCILLTAGIAIFFPLLVNRNFSDAYEQIPLQLISALLFSILGIFSGIYIAFKKTVILAQTSVLAAIVNIVTNLLMIRHIGLYAAPLSTIAAYSLLLILRYLDIRKFMKLSFPFSIVVRMGILCAVNCCAYYSSIFWLKCLNLAFQLAAAFFCNRHLLRKILSLLRKKVFKSCSRN